MAAVEPYRNSLCGDDTAQLSNRFFFSQNLYFVHKKFISLNLEGMETVIATIIEVAINRKS